MNIHGPVSQSVSQPGRGQCLVACIFCTSPPRSQVRGSRLPPWCRYCDHQTSTLVRTFHWLPSGHLSTAASDRCPSSGRDNDERQTNGQTESLIANNVVRALMMTSTRWCGVEKHSFFLFLFLEPCTFSLSWCCCLQNYSDQDELPPRNSTPCILFVFPWIFFRRFWHFSDVSSREQFDGY